MSALAFASKALGYSECLGDFRVRRMLEGWRREEGLRRDPRQPLTPGILKGLLSKWDSVCSSEYEKILFHSAALLAFFGAFRIGELVAQSKGDRSNRALLVGDVVLSDDTIRV